MSGITMAADSTHVDRGNKCKSSNHTISKKYHKCTSKSVRKHKMERSPSSSSSSSSWSESSSGQQKYSRRKSHRIEGDSCSDHESDLDLSKDLLPIGGYVFARDKMVEHMFRSISIKKLKAMLPEILKTIDLVELKQLCVEQLEGMSKKRICRIIDGDDAQNISSSGTDEDDLGHEQKSEDNGHLRNDCSTSNQVACATFTNSLEWKKLSCSKNQERDIKTPPRQTNEAKQSIDKAKSESSSQKAMKELTNCYLDSSSKIVENTTWKVSSSNKLSAVGTLKKIEEQELDYDENETSSVHSHSSIPSLASEPQDTCIPFKLCKTTRGSSYESPTSKQISDMSASVRASELKQIDCRTSKAECSHDAAATAACDEHMSLVVERSPERPSSVQHRATSSSQTSTDVAQARVENENNLNVEAEYDRNTLPAVRFRIDNTFASADCSEINRPGVSRADSKTMSLDNESDRPFLKDSALQSHDKATEKIQPVTVDLSGSCCDADDMMFNVVERDFSDDEVVKSISPISLFPSGITASRATARSDEHRTRTVRLRRTAENVDERQSCVTSTDIAKNERRRSADDASSAIAPKLQQRSFPSDTSIVSMEKRTLNLNCESILNVDEYSESSSACEASSVSLKVLKSAQQNASVKKIRITRPFPTGDSSVPDHARRNNCYAKSTDASVHSDPKQNKTTQSSKRLSPEALSKTQLEILELEMRARAIKAMLRAQEELEKKTSSKPSEQLEKSRQRCEPYRDRANVAQRGLVSKRTFSLSALRNMSPSPPASRRRVIHRSRIVETIARRRLRQFVLRDRLTRFNSQTPVMGSSDARLQLNGVSAGGRVVTQRASASGSCIVHLPSQQVGVSVSATSSSNVYRGRRFNRQFKAMRPVAESSSVNRSDVRRVFMTTQPRRLVKMTSTKSERTVKVSGQSLKQLERKNR